MTIRRDSAGFVARMESSDRMQAPADEMLVTRTPAGVRFVVPNYGEATLALDSIRHEMRGLVGAHRQPVHLELKRVFDIGDPGRVVREEVNARNGDVTLSGTLVRPAASARYPVVIWVPGRGATVAAENQLVRALAARGIASLIYDIRGHGRSSGDAQAATVADLIGDLTALARSVRTHPRVDAARVGLVAQSAGAWVAPRVAADERLAFLALVVGPVGSVYDQQVHAYESILRRSDARYTDAEIQAALGYVRVKLAAVLRGGDIDAYRRARERLRGARTAGVVVFPDPVEARDTSWLRRNAYDNRGDLRRVRAPVLALYAALDDVVPPEVNEGTLRELMVDAGNRDVTVVVLADLDHNMYFRYDTHVLGSPPLQEAVWSWPRLSPEYPETLISWLVRQTRQDQTRGSPRDDS